MLSQSSQIRKTSGVKHKVFLSYYHRDDQFYRDFFENAFKHLYITKTVQPGDINTDNSTEYIRRLIREDYISDASIVIVLVGPKTRCRKHVDWEVSAGLSRSAGGLSGLVGILLPEFPLTRDHKYSSSDLPLRLSDNVSTGYASLESWSSIASNAEYLTKILDGAFDRRQTHAGYISNSRQQMVYNTCE